MKHWPQEAYHWYSDACSRYDYPGLPYGQAIKALVTGTDTVLDLGCGIGAASVMIAPWCKQVIALDQDEHALHWLTAKAREYGLLNIETVHAGWPPQTPMQVDVLIALHVYQAMHSLENLKLVFESVTKGGFIACNASYARDEEPFIELKEELGLKPSSKSCASGCYIKGVLEALGADVKCEQAVYEFGQPMDNLNEVLRFLCWKSGANDATAHIVEKYVDRYAVKSDAGYVVPIKRRSCGITFLK